MNMKFLDVDSDADCVDVHAAIWANRNVGVDRADNMTEAIQSLLSKTEYLFVAINGDTVDFMPLLSTMRSVTNLPILIVTGSFTTEKEVMAMEAGADLYARWHNKPEDNIKSVLAHVTHLAVRSKMPRPETKIMVHKDLLIAPRLRFVFVGNKKIDLTKKEFDILYYFMGNHGIVLTYKQIYRKIWGTAYDDSGHSLVWNHVHSLRQKLMNASEYIINEIDVGYRFITPADK